MTTSNSRDMLQEERRAARQARYAGLRAAFGDGRKYSPDQSRADNGEFGEGAGAGAAAGTSGGYTPSKQPIFYRTATYRDVMAGRINDRKHNVPGKGDLLMYTLAHEIGFAGAPQVVSKAQLDGYIKAGETPLYRGVADPAQAEQFKTGDYWAGQGVAGGGTYVATGGKPRSAAAYYAGKDGEVMRMTLRADAHTISRDALITMYKSAPDSSVINDLGRFGMSKGYDAITGSSGGETIILNRTAVRVQKEAA